MQRRLRRPRPKTTMLVLMKLITLNTEQEKKLTRRPVAPSNTPHAVTHSVQQEDVQLLLLLRSILFSSAAQSHPPTARSTTRAM